jgi:hypothetical protein
VLFRREVRVGGRRTNTGLGGDHANRQAGEALSAKYLNRGVAEPINGIGLLGGQSASG